MATPDKKVHKTLVFLVRGISNLHPGAGDSFYGAVDKTVQRDPATNRPAIFASSIKGALREYFEEECGYGQKSPFVYHVFGTPVKPVASDDPQAAKAEDNMRPGKYRFFSADLLSLPAPDTDPDSDTAYHRVSDPEALSEFVEKISMLQAGIWADNLDLITAIEKALGEGAELKTEPEHAAKFREIAEELPVIARNQLENGKSENLWYEEILPRESLFGFVVQADEHPGHLEAFKALDGQVVQIGANATVGYGYCRFTLLNN